MGDGRNLESFPLQIEICLPFHLHSRQSVFEGLNAFPLVNGGINIFRPDDARREDAPLL